MNSSASNVELLSKSALETDINQLLLLFQTICLKCLAQQPQQNQPSVKEISSATELNQTTSSENFCLYHLQCKHCTNECRVIRRLISTDKTKCKVDHTPVGVPTQVKGKYPKCTARNKSKSQRVVQHSNSAVAQAQRSFHPARRGRRRGPPAVPPAVRHVHLMPPAPITDVQRDQASLPVQSITSIPTISSESSAVMEEDLDPVASTKPSVVGSVAAPKSKSPSPKSGFAKPRILPREDNGDNESDNECESPTAVRVQPVSPIPAAQQTQPAQVVTPSVSVETVSTPVVSSGVSSVTAVSKNESQLSKVSRDRAGTKSQPPKSQPSKATSALSTLAKNSLRFEKTVECINQSLHNLARHYEGPTEEHDWIRQCQAERDRGYEHRRRALGPPPWDW